jgi:hypothetical protein
MSSQLSPEEYDTPITWVVSQVVSTQCRGERPGECLMKLQSSTLPIYSNLPLSLSPIYITLPPSISHRPSLHVSLTLSHPSSLSPPLLVTSLSLWLPPSIPLYSTHSDPPIISLWLSLTLTSSLPVYLSPLSFSFSTYLSNTHPLYLFIPII